MRRTILFAVFVAFLAVTVNAQKSKVTSAALALQQQDYKKALKYADEAISKPELLKSKFLAKAYYTKARAILLGFSKKDTALIAQHGALGLYNISKKAKEADATYAGDVAQFHKQINPLIFNAGLGIYQTALQSKDEQQQKALLEMAKSHFVISDEIQKDQYFVSSLLGSTYFYLKDNKNAMTQLDKAIKLYEAFIVTKDSKGNPRKPDENMVASIQELGTIYVQQKQPKKAIEVYENGKKLFPTNATINKNLLLIYLSSPELKSQATKKFEDAIKQNPKDVLIRLGYAQLLEQENTEKAVEQYKKALEFEPNNFAANYNVGAMYVNKAKVLNDKADEISDNKEAEKLQAEAIELMKTALPYIEKAYSVKNDDLQTVQDLIGLYAYLEKTDEMNKMLQRKQELISKMQKK